MNISNIYGIAAGVILLFVGIVLLFLKRLDAMLANSESTDKDIRKNRLIISIMAIIGGLISLSTVLLGWPPIKGYIIPPPK
jgi:ABC-type enterochelin transport system permease subunit